MFNYYSKIGFLNFLPRNGADDVKISDLWEDFFWFHTKFLPLGKLRWNGFQAFGAEDLEDLEGQYLC